MNSRDISRFISNLSDENIALEAYDSLLRQFNWMGAVVTDTDIQWVFQSIAGRDITETEYDLVRNDLEESLEALLQKVAMEHLHSVCYEVLKGIQ